MTLRVSYKFATLPDPALYEFGEKINVNMTANAAYPTLPTNATLAMLLTANDDFKQKTVDASMGGEMATTAKDLARQEDLKFLRRLAGYVQITANNMEELLSSGFEARSSNNASAPLAQPAGVTVKNGVAGQLIARLGHPVKNTNLYEGRASIDGGTTWLPSVFTGKSRAIIFEGLTAGATYTIQVRALGGSTGQSDWSDPISHMSM
jgi:hypothetical protein